MPFRIRVKDKYMLKRYGHLNFWLLGQSNSPVINMIPEIAGKLVCLIKAVLKYNCSSIVFFSLV